MGGPSPLPLHGLRVIEIGTMITAPLTAMILAEMGAEVIKIERPEGDPFRSFVGGSYAPHFRAYNKGKASVTLDLRQEADRVRLRALLKGADALVENFRPGVMDRLGFSADYPALVHCSITGFGTDGPYHARPAYDTVALALSGIANLKVDPENPGISGPTISDNVTGMYAAQAILAALLGRARGGPARRVEVNMLEASIAFIPDSFAMAEEGHAVDRLTRVRASQSFAMTTADARVLVIHLSSAVKFWDALLAATEDPVLSDDERFATRQGRYENYTDLQETLKCVFRTRTLADWSARLSDNDVPFSPALRIDEVPENEQVRHLGSFTTIEAADGLTYRAIAAPVRFDGKRPPLRRAPPLLGQDNADFTRET